MRAPLDKSGRVQQRGAVLQPLNRKPGNNHGDNDYDNGNDVDVKRTKAAIRIQAVVRRHLATIAVLHWARRSHVAAMHAAARKIQVRHVSLGGGGVPFGGVSWAISRALLGVPPPGRTLWLCRCRQASYRGHASRLRMRDWRFLVRRVCACMVQRRFRMYIAKRTLRSLRGRHTEVCAAW